MDGAVENVVADADFETAEEGGIDEIFDIQIRAVLQREIGENPLTGAWVELNSAFDRHLAAFDVEAGELLQSGEDRPVVAGFILGEAGENGAQLAGFQMATGLAKAEKAACGGGGGFGDLHKERGGK